MDDPERIWLEPGEGFYPTFGRTWCPADDWEGEGIEYIRADLAAAHTRAAVEAPEARIVAWLRGEIKTAYTDPQYDIGINLADAIERGEPWRDA